MKHAFRRSTCCHCLLTFRTVPDRSTTPAFEPALLAAEFHPYTS